MLTLEESSQTRRGLVWVVSEVVMELYRVNHVLVKFVEILQGQKLDVTGRHPRIRTSNSIETVCVKGQFVPSFLPALLLFLFHIP